jgi:acyl carrier protein
MKETIKKYIIEKIVGEEIDFADDASLFGEGIIDSLGQVKLISFLEKHYNITIDSGEITTENFDTINQIVALVEKKLKK